MLGWGPLNNQTHIHLKKVSIHWVPESPFKGLQQRVRQLDNEERGIFVLWRLFFVAENFSGFLMVEVLLGGFFVFCREFLKCSGEIL